MATRRQGTQRGTGRTGTGTPAGTRTGTRSRRASAAGGGPIGDDAARAPRTGARRTVLSYVAEFPAYLRLLAGLMTDRRVPGLDKLLVAGAILYIVTPLDLIPDIIPFMGDVDDLFLLILALQRLIANAGRKVVASHWSGDPEDLSPAALRAVLGAAAFFLPKTIRRRLRVLGRSPLF
jgi:uncharacterized membrane protein YkvA (DUF1232 family)